MSGARPPQGANYAPSGGSAAAPAASVGAHERRSHSPPCSRIPRSGAAATARPSPPRCRPAIAALDAVLPGRGWPQGALTEILLAREGIGEIRLTLPALARLQAQRAATSCGSRRRTCRTRRRSRPRASISRGSSSSAAAAPPMRCGPSSRRCARPSAAPRSPGSARATSACCAGCRSPRAKAAPGACCGGGPASAASATAAPLRLGTRAAGRPARGARAEAPRRRARAAGPDRRRRALPPRPPALARPAAPRCRRPASRADPRSSAGREDAEPTRPRTPCRRRDLTVRTTLPTRAPRIAALLIPILIRPSHARPPPLHDGLQQRLGQPPSAHRVRAAVAAGFRRAAHELLPVDQGDAQPHPHRRLVLRRRARARAAGRAAAIAEPWRFFDPQEPFDDLRRALTPRSTPSTAGWSRLRSADRRRARRGRSPCRAARASRTRPSTRLLAHLFQHQIHHRGQAHAMLAGTPVAPPQLDEFFCANEAHLRAAGARRDSGCPKRRSGRTAPAGLTRRHVASRPPSRTPLIRDALGLPALAVAAARRLRARARLTTRSAPFAVGSGGHYPRIVAANAAARAAGIRAGQLISAALALAPDARAARPRCATPKRARSRQSRRGRSRSRRRSSLAPPDAVVAEIGGSLRLFGGLTRLARARSRDGVAARWATRARLALAPTPRAALLLARAGRTRARAAPRRSCPRARAVAARAARPRRRDARRRSRPPASRRSARRGAAARRARAALRRGARRHARSRARPRARSAAAVRAAAAFRERRLDAAGAGRTTSRRSASASTGSCSELAGWLLARGLGVVAMSLALAHERYVRAARHAADRSCRSRSARRRARRRICSRCCASASRASRCRRRSRRSRWRATRPRRSPAATSACCPDDDADAVDVPLRRPAARAARRRRRRRASRRTPSIGPNTRCAMAARGRRAHAQPSRARPARGRSARRRPLPWPALPDPAPAVAARRSRSRSARLLEAQPWVLRDGPERIESGWWDGADVRRDYFVAESRTASIVWIYRDHRYGTDDGEWFLHGVFA